jgi:hypothetical protein
MVEIISVHVPKTAGTTFLDILLKIYGHEKVLRDYPPHETYSCRDPLPSHIKVVHGHFLPIKYHDQDAHAKRIVWLRHPLSRLASEYLFAKKTKDDINPVHIEIAKGKLSFLDFCMIPEMRNFMSYQLQGCRLDDFYFVGIQEFFLDDLAELKLKMRWPFFQFESLNKGTFSEFQAFLKSIMANKPLMNKVIQNNEEDMCLYQNALSLRGDREGIEKIGYYPFATTDFLQASLHHMADNQQVYQNYFYQRWLALKPPLLLRIAEALRRTQYFLWNRLKIFLGEK